MWSMRGGGEFFIFIKDHVFVWTVYLYKSLKYSPFFLVYPPKTRKKFVKLTIVLPDLGLGTSP